MDTAVRMFVERLDAAVASVAAADHIGSYVHGSVALGGFVPGRSDIDALFVVRDRHTFDVGLLATRLVEAAQTCPGRGIEVSVVGASTAAHPAAPWPFVLHLTTGPSDCKTVVGASHAGDPDLLMHHAVTRAAGLVISGPPPEHVFGAIDAAAIRRYLIDELTSSLESASRAYAVLNACRAWQFVATGALVSKVAGAAWAMSRTNDGALIRAALDEQLGTGPAGPADDRTRAFVSSVVDLLMR